MTQSVFDLLAQLASSPDHGWSIGSFGAIGEFVRGADEPATINRADNLFEIYTDRGGMRIAPTQPLVPIAWDSLSADGESWGQHFDFCIAQPETPSRVIRDLGTDADAVRPQDRQHRIFDMGVACGAITMAIRSDDADFIALMERHVGQEVLGVPEIYIDTLRAQPHRVLISAAGRVEVYQDVPPADGKSPEGPHTHLIANIVPKHRPHGSNTPLPKGQQSAISVHIASPWRTLLGERHSYCAEQDTAFIPYLRQYALADDQAVEQALIRAVTSGAAPDDSLWPATRRGRTKARITLRRMAVAGDHRTDPWRAKYDRAVDSDAETNIPEGEEA